jgi:hypothetical protein
MYVELVSLAVVLAEETSSGKDAGRASNNDLIDCGGGNCKAMAVPPLLHDAQDGLHSFVI